MKALLATLNDWLPNGMRISTTDAFQYEDYACLPIAAEQSADPEEPRGFILSRSSGEISLVTAESDTPNQLWNGLVDAMRHRVEERVSPVPASRQEMSTDYWYG
jgi:hypothetical protein